MAEPKNFCQTISQKLNENKNFFYNLLKSQELKKESTNNEVYLIESKYIEKIKNIINGDKSQNDIKDQKTKASLIEKIIDSIKPITFSSTSEFIKVLKEDKKQFALIFIKELGDILVKNNKTKEKNFIFKFSFNSRKELKIYLEEKKDPIVFKLNERFTIDKDNLIEILVIIEEILKKINRITIEKKKKAFYLMDKKVYEKLKELKEKKNQIKIDDIIELNKKYKKKENCLNNVPKKKFTYYNEFLLLDNEILSLLIKIGFNREDYYVVECLAINEEELLIIDSSNNIVQIGTLNDQKVFETKVLMEIEDYSENFAKKIQEKKGFKNLENYGKTTILKNDNIVFYSLRKKEKEKEKGKQKENEKEINKDKGSGKGKEKEKGKENEKEKEQVKEKGQGKEKEKIEIIFNYNKIIPKFQNGINVLLSIYSFESSLLEKIKLFEDNNKNFEKLNEDKYYLISKKWINDYKKFYLYGELKKILNKYFEKSELNNLSSEIRRIIFNNMFEKYKDEFENNLKKNQNNYFLLDEAIYSTVNEKQVDDMDIINEKILNNLNYDNEKKKRIKGNEFKFENIKGKLYIKIKNQKYGISEKNGEIKFIDYFEENQFKILNEYYILKKKINDDIKNKTISKESYYLVNNEWMKKFEEYYSSLYDNTQTNKSKKDKNKIKYPEEILENDDEFNCSNIDNIKIDDKDFNYIKSFSLLNESLLTEFCERKNKTIKYESGKKCILNEGKIIINYYKKKDSGYLIIGEYKNNEILEIQGIMLFEDYDSLKKTFTSLRETTINKFMQYYVKNDKIYDKNNKEIGNYFKRSNNKEKNSLKCSKKIEFLIQLKSFYDGLKIKIDNSSKNQNNKNYYLINKRWLDEYKSFINYGKFLEIFKNIQNYNLTDQKLMLKIQNELNIKEDDFISKEKYPNKIDTKKNKYVNEYYENFEIFSESLIDLLLSINSKLPKKEIYIKVNCYFSNKKILIKFNDNKFNICSFENNILENELILIKKEECKDSIIDLFNSDFFSFLLYNNKGVRENNDFVILNLNPISNKLEIENRELFICIISFINSIIIKKKLKLDIKNNYKNQDIKYEKYYIINYKNLIEYIKANGLYNILSHLNENANEEKYINIIFNNDYKFEEKVNKIISLINEKLIQEFKTAKKTKYDFHKIIEIEQDNISNGERQIDFLKNFMLLNEEAATIFNKSIFQSGNFLFGDNKLFLELNDMIYIFILKENAVFNIEQILYLENLRNSTSSSKKSKSKIYIDYISKLFIENGYNKFFNNYFESINEYVSLIFLDKNEFIGYCYKIDSSVNDYSLYHLNKELEKMVIIYYFNESIKLLIESKTYYENYFYLINQGYFESYEESHHFDQIKGELKNQSIIKNLLSKKKESNEYFNKDNILLNEKEIVLILRNLPKQNSELNKENIIKTFYSQDEPDYMNLDYYDEDKKVKSLIIYHKFRLIHQSIFISFFGEKKAQRNNYTKCIFVNGLIFITLSKFINQEIKNKIIYEIGALNQNNIFEPKYILICKKEDLVGLINDLKYNVAKFLRELNFGNENTLPLYLGKKYYGIIINTEIKISEPIKNNDEEEIDTIIKPNEGRTIKDDFSSPQLIGLQNVGATCYMNATLQCFCQIEKFVNYFKYNNYINEVCNNYKKNNKLCLTVSFKELIENLWPSVYEYICTKYNFRNSNNPYFAPYKFKKKISEMNNLFEGAQANDSKDLVNFIVMTLHEELNRAKNIKFPNEENKIIDQSDPLNVYKYFLRNFKNENESIISEIFYAINGTCSKCSKCNIEKYNFQAYFFLIFPLEEVRKFKMNKMLNQFVLMNQNMMNINPILYQQCLSNFQLSINNINSVNIYECFEYNQKIDFFTGENAMFCNFCKEQLPSSYQTFLYTTPEILIIVLNRGKGIEFKIKLEFLEDLNLMNFVYNKQNVFYKLIGVVTHLGESGASGHFISYCKSPIDGKWYSYNDDIVSKVTDFKKEIIDFAMPYILFFQKT